MPINPDIALQGKPVQFDSAGIVNMLQRGQALRMQQEAHAQQMQLGAQHIEEGKAAVQKSQIEARDQQIKQQAFLNSKGDPKATVQAAISMGASPDAVMSLQKHDADLQEKYAKTDSDKLPVRKYQNEQMLGLHDQAIDLATKDPQAYANGGWQKLYDAALQIDPSNADHLDRNTPLSVDQLRLSQVAHATDAYYLTQAEEKRKQAGEVRAQSVEQRASMMAGPQLEKATAEAAAANRSQDASMLANAARQGPGALATALQQLSQTSPDRIEPFMRINGQSKPEDILKLGMTPDQQVTTGQTAKTAEETARHNKIEEGQGAARVSLSQQEQKLRQKQFDATYGSLVDPVTGKAMEPEAAKAIASQDPLAAAVANYQAPPPPTGRGGPGASIMRKVLAINPDYNAQNWQAQGGLMKDFTSGKSATELVAINTALGHVGVLNQAIDALNNGDIRILNSIGNRLGLETGTSPAAVFKTIVHRVGPELVKAYAGAGGGQEERQSAGADFNPDLAPQTIKANVAMTAKLLDSKIQAKVQQWKGTMGTRPLPFGLTTEAQATMKQLTGTGGDSGLSVTFNGHVFGPFKDKASLDQFKKDQGIK